MIRHGIAAPREDYTNDEERPLTNKGRSKTNKIAQQLRKRDLQFDLILTSPLLRAQETAQILKEAGLSPQVEEFPALAPDGDIQAWVSWLAQQPAKGKDYCLAVIGHQPDLGNWVQMLVWGKASEKIVLKKAGIIGVRVPTTEPFIGRSELFLLISPKWLL